MEKINPSLLDKLPNISRLKNDVEKNVKSILQAKLAKLDLVTREEFEIQQQLLQRAYGKIIALEKQMSALEQSLDIVQK